LSAVFTSLSRACLGKLNDHCERLCLSQGIFLNTTTHQRLLFCLFCFADGWMDRGVDAANVLGYPPVVSKNGLFEPFICKNEHFTKTGSGQT
jgi:hypothetical protein